MEASDCKQVLILFTILLITFYTLTRLSANEIASRQIKTAYLNRFHLVGTFLAYKQGKGFFLEALIHFLKALIFQRRFSHGCPLQT
jgi:hypothetical protein